MIIFKKKEINYCQGILRNLLYFYIKIFIDEELVNKDKLIKKSYLRGMR